MSGFRVLFTYLLSFKSHVHWQLLKIKMVELVGSLANSLANKVEESKEAIQKNNAHKSVDTQLIY